MVYFENIILYLAYNIRIFFNEDRILVTRGRLVTVKLGCSTGYTCLILTSDSKSISQSYRCFAKPYCGMDPVKYLAERARSARQVSQSPSVATK
jgi:hypothetical protein